MSRDTTTTRATNPFAALVCKVVESVSCLAPDRSPFVLFATPSLLSPDPLLRRGYGTDECILSGRYARTVSRVREELAHGDPGLYHLLPKPIPTVALPLEKTPTAKCYYKLPCYSKNLVRWSGQTLARAASTRAGFAVMIACWRMGWDYLEGDAFEAACASLDNAIRYRPTGVFNPGQYAEQASAAIGEAYGQSIRLRGPHETVPAFRDK